MALINTIEDIRKYGVKAMFFNEDSSLADITGAELQFLQPLLGQTLYEEVLAQAQVDSAIKTLVDLCKRVVAPLAYWMELPLLQINISDKGIGSFSSENMQAAHRWEYEELKDALADKGCYALEQLLQHLFDNKSTYNWTLPVDYKTTFLTGKEFAKYYPVYQPYRTFESLRPIVKQVEDQYVRTTVGDEFFEYLRDNAAPTAEEKNALDFLKKAIANLTIKTAIEVLPVKLSTNGFTVLLGDAGDKKTKGEQSAPSALLNITYTSVERTGESYLMRLKDYLNSKASDSVFSTFKNSSYYAAPVDSSTIENPNATRKIFGF
jgi:hypothetical protein